MGACLNVTESKIATEIKRVSEEKFRTIATHPDYWEYWQGIDGEMIHVSPSCEKITGYHAEDFFSDSQLLKKIIHPDDALLMQQHLVKLNSPAHLFLTEEIDIKILNNHLLRRWVEYIGHSPLKTLMVERISQNPEFDFLPFCPLLLGV